MVTLATRGKRLKEPELGSCDWTGLMHSAPGNGGGPAAEAQGHKAPPPLQRHHYSGGCQAGSEARSQLSWTWQPRDIGVQNPGGCGCCGDKLLNRAAYYGAARRPKLP